MNDLEELDFLAQKIKALRAVTRELEDAFPEKSFTLDGILVGNIVELMVSRIFGITLYEQSKKTHDGIIDGKEVQIKGTQNRGPVIIRDVPDYLIVAYLDKKTGKVQEIYNGPGAHVKDKMHPVSGMNHHIIRVSTLQELNDSLSEEQKLVPKYPEKWSLLK